MEQDVLEGMPEPDVLHLHASDGQVLVTVGRSVLYRYDADDTGMRNLVIVALTDARRRVDEVAALFGLSATYVSILRGRVRQEGSAALVRRRGRPPKLSGRQVAKARAWAGQGLTQQQIADRLGVVQSVISQLLARLGPAPVQQQLPQAPIEQAAGEPVAQLPRGPVQDGDDEPASEQNVTPEVGVRREISVDGEKEEPADGAAVFAGSARIAAGRYPCRYAGVMLLHAYLDRVDAAGVFATLSGGPARRYDDLGVLTGAALGFALGAGTIQGAGHLCRAQAGAALGLACLPEVKTLRARLAALADGADPLAVQRAFAARMLAADPASDPVYFVDEHFVPYTGARPVAKGWNTKRRHAEPGRDDTLLVDARGRAVVFTSGEPSGLAQSLPEVLAQLRAVIGPDAPVLLGFDRGGAYPATFTACRQAGAHWLTYRRAPLAPVAATAKRSWTVRHGKRLTLRLADETVELNGYGPARQLTLFEHDRPVLQVLTSQTGATTGADLVCWLRSRWRIENMFKYAAEHNGIDAIACYGMDIEPDQRKVTNPARATARAAVKTAEADLAAAERALPQLLNNPQVSLKDKNAALPRAHARIQTAQTALEEAKAALKPIPAKVALTELDPHAKRARPHLARRGLQMVLRLLAFNAEAWLAEHLNAYLNDPDEYRATTRHLLHQGGTIHYQPKRITVTLDRPDTPRITAALTLLIDELNATPAHIPGDRRPITYQLSPA